MFLEHVPRTLNENPVASFQDLVVFRLVPNPPPRFFPAAPSARAFEARNPFGKSP